MEEYSVGSLADLITGSNTPNKPKVVVKKIKKKEIQEPDASPETNNIKKSKRTEKNEKEPKLKKRKLKNSTETNSLASDDEANVSQTKKKKLKNSTKTNSFADSDNDEDNSSQNDINAERRVKKKAKAAEKKEIDPEVQARTLFVGNVPITTSKNTVKKYFRKYGIIESVRVRGIPVKDIKTPKKIAAIKREYHPDRKSIICYIKFQNEEDAVKAEAENGTLFNEHHLRVHRAGTEDKPDESKAIFVGNLSFDAEEEELWKLFESCGEIESIRIVRDPLTRIGKGFAYVNFKEADAVQLALEMENTQIRNREIRISLCNLNLAKKMKRKNRIKKLQIKRAGKPRKPFRPRKELNAEGERQSNNSDEPRKDYQGFKFSDKKKKNKLNKGLLEKKRMAKKIAPRQITN